MCAKEDLGGALSTVSYSVQCYIFPQGIVSHSDVTYSNATDEVVTSGTKELY